MALTLASNAITFTDSTSLSSGIITSAQLSAGTVTTEKIAPGAVQRQNIGYSGAVLQVVQTTKVNRFLSTSGSPTDIPGLSAIITPTSTNSKVLITGTVTVAGEMWFGGSIFLNIVRNNNPIFLSTSGNLLNATAMYTAWSNSQANTWGNTSPLSFSYLDSPNSIGPQTYKIQGFIQNPGYDWVINYRYDVGNYGGTSSLTLMEIS